jgi:hypothetical protein
MLGPRIPLPLRTFCRHNFREILCPFLTCFPLRRDFLPQQTFFTKILVYFLYYFVNIIML